MHSKPRGKRTIDSNNISLSVVNDNRVRNRINDPDPPLSGTVYLFKQARVLEQSPKAEAEEGQPFQMFRGNIRRDLPSRKGCAEALAMAEKRHGNLKGFVNFQEPNSFRRGSPANDRFLKALSLRKVFRCVGGQNFARQTPIGMPCGFQDPPALLPGSATATNTTRTKGLTHRLAEETE
jgi:hypothetical protein